VASAALCAGAAVALVKASDHSPTKGRQPLAAATPTPSASTPAPSATPTATPTPAPTATTAAPTASATPRATSTPSRTTRPTPEPVDLAPAVELALDPASGDTTTSTVFRLDVRATDTAGPLTLSRVSWGDGAVATNVSGRSCTAPAGEVCAFFSVTHTYSAVGSYTVTAVVSDGTLSTTVRIQANVAAPAPSPTP
jgi:hypothetical protein